ncbi:MAG: ribosomal-protein-alanine N-acetyltransferase [Planctomycetota bacterium]|jgi:ribosomal-protein-alanine N-acetyltransferase
MSFDPKNPLQKRPIVEHMRLLGELVVIRPIRPNDAAQVFRSVSGRDEILRWLCWPGPKDEAELATRFANWRTDEELSSDYQFAICDVISNRLVGTISLRFSGHPDQGDIGYWVDADHWGRGFASEAVELVTYLAFHYGLGHVLFGWVFVGNEASKRVLEKSGYSLEYTSKKQVEKLGREIEEWYLLQTRAEWIPRLGGWRPEAEEVQLMKFDREKA